MYIIQPGVAEQAAMALGQIILTMEPRNFSSSRTLPLSAAQSMGQMVAGTFYAIVIAMICMLADMEQKGD